MAKGPLCGGERGEDSDKISSIQSPSRHIVVPTGERDLGRGNTIAASENFTPGPSRHIVVPSGERGEYIAKKRRMPSPSSL
jgi:hypothetical protein